MDGPNTDDYKKAHVIHHGKESVNVAGSRGYGTTRQAPVDYVVDKDGNIHKLGAPNSDGTRAASEDTINITDENGHLIKSGSQEAKDIYNKTDPNDPNQYSAVNAPTTEKPDTVPIKATGDQTLFAVPEKLTNAGVNWGKQAGFILDTTSDLNSLSDILHEKLTTVSKTSFDTFWVDWSKTLLDLANQTEKVAVLLSNSAVAYLEADANILKAFHGDPAVEKQINDDIKTIEDQQKEFKDKFKKQADKEKEVENKAQADKDILKKEHVIHVGDPSPRSGGGYKFTVDKDGNLYDHYSGKKISSVHYHGHNVDSGSQEAKEIFSKGTSDPGSWQGYGK
jgi:hypothetical protein